MPTAELSNPTTSSPNETHSDMPRTFTSPSKRTQISVVLYDDGSGHIDVMQDGHTLHSITIPEEQAGADGVPKSERQSPANALGSQ